MTGVQTCALPISQIIGCLIFLTNCSHDIAYDVGRLSRYTHSPSVEYWDTISILLIYSKGTFIFVCHIVVIMLF